MAFFSSLKQIAGIESSSIAQEFMPEFFKLVLGTLSLPIDLPGTNYRRAFQVNYPQISPFFLVFWSKHMKPHLFFLSF